jgi:3-mercaptopyruvate sulfurtransferase SseA
MMYLGVENDDTVVVYGGKNCFRSALCVKRSSDRSIQC